MCERKFVESDKCVWDMMGEGFDLAEDLAFAVQAVEDKLRARFLALNPNFRKINYIYGRPSEINAEIQKLSAAITEETRMEKYPLFGLYEPFTVVHPKDGSYPYVTGLEMIIAMPSEKDWSSYTRQQENVKPFLIPIYDELFEQLRQRKIIICQNPKKDLAHSKTVHKGGKFFNDLVDCIEIKGLDLKFKFSHC